MNARRTDLRRGTKSSCGNGKLLNNSRTRLFITPTRFAFLTIKFLLSNRFAKHRYRKN